MQDFHNIKSRQEFSNLLKIKLKELTYVLYIRKTDNLYVNFTIPKKNGDIREICSPDNNLKRIQKRLANVLEKHYDKYLEEYGIKRKLSHGYVKGKNIITNAEIHRRKKIILNIDIEDFFSSFHFGRIRGFFEKNRLFNFPVEIATIIAQISCFKGSLPQGSPLSPTISNLIFNIVDLKILKLANKYKLDYTRYVDDLSFSTNDIKFKKNIENFLNELNILIIDNGFRINKSKTRLIYSNSKQEVTGLTVNRIINSNKLFIKNTRAMAHSLYKNDKFMIDGQEGTINQLEGRFSFINQLDKYNNQLSRRLKSKQRNSVFYLNTREKQYQKFLFYKYFYNPSIPVIITEGKTDILYLKAALKKYHLDFPKLISFENGTFKYNIYFFNKTKRLSYFFNISMDGADTMKNIYNFYSGKNQYPNLYKSIDNLKNYREINKRNPVFLLFDNERYDKKPLCSFLKYIKADLIENNLQLHIANNLFLLTIPLVNNKIESTIEDLLPQEILNAEIQGRKFLNERNDEQSLTKFNLANFVFENFREVDLSNFLPLLKEISNTVENNNL